jgi:hypothetical protein
MKKSKNWPFARTLKKKDSNKKTVDKYILVSATVLAREPYLHPYGR